MRSSLSSLRRPAALVLGALLCALGPARARAQEGDPQSEENTPGRQRGGSVIKPQVRPIMPARLRNKGGAQGTGTPAEAEAEPARVRPGALKAQPNPTRPSAAPVGPAPVNNRPSIAPGNRAIGGGTVVQPGPNEPPPDGAPVDKKQAGRNASSVQMNFDKRDLAEVIQFVANFTQRNFILPERVSGKITILSNNPIPADEVWNVFVAALDANNWAVYPVGDGKGRYWKLSEKKQSARANIPTFLDPNEKAPASEQMVTKLFKLRYVEADQMRNTINQFTSRDSDFQIFPPDTLIISDLGLNMRRLERLIEQLDQPGGSEEIHIVQVQYAGAQELAQKLNEIFQQQQQKSPGGARQLGLGEPVMPGQVPQAPAAVPGMAGPQASQSGPVTVSKIIAEDRTNKLIVISPGKSFQRVIELIKQLDVPASEGGVHVHYLENAKAEDVAQTLQSLAQGAGAGKRRSGNAPGAPVPTSAPAAGGGGPVNAELFSGDVKITADKSTNSLVITASNADYRNVVKVIEKLDIRQRQVFVEAVIMEINLSNDSDLGAALHAGSVIDNLSFRGAKGSAPIVFGSELGGLNSLGGVTSLASLSGFLAGIQGPPITVPGINLTLPSFGILMNALQSSSDVNVISTPTLIMTNNSDGEITVGQNVPFLAGATNTGLGSLLNQGGATGTGGTTSALGGILGGSLGLGGLGSLYAPIQRQNVELRLKIKPQINESDYVRLEVDEQTEEIASNDKQLGPTTSKRTAKTTVVAKDQETVVLGGLIQERTLKSVQKIPVLGSIPVLGWLFRSEQTKKSKTNLLLFLTPYIIRDQTDYRRIFERKMAERAEFVKRFTGDDEQYQVAIDYSKKPSPLTRVKVGIDRELSRAENGGQGAVDERVLRPTQPAAQPSVQQPGTVRPIQPTTPAEPAAEPQQRSPADANQPPPPKEGQPRPVEPSPPPSPDKSPNNPNDR